MKAQFIIEDKNKEINKNYDVWLAGNVNPALRSEICNTLCSVPFNDGNLPDFTAFWEYNPKKDEWWISLRGVETKSPDLSVISNLFGGGGHSMASGFTIKSTKGLRENFLF